MGVLACMGPSMHKATEGAGVAIFSDPHTGCAHSSSPCHTGAAMAYWVNETHVHLSVILCRGCHHLGGCVGV